MNNYRAPVYATAVVSNRARTRIPAIIASYDMNRVIDSVPLHPTQYYTWREEAHRRKKTSTLKRDGKGEERRATAVPVY